MPEDIKAHITGVVFQVVAHPGDAVSEGDPVIVLESMKMEIPVESPRSGVVKTIPVHMVETLNRISRVNRGMVNELGREPTPEELAQRTGVPAKKVRLILESSRKPLSLETPIGEDSELGDFLEDKSAGSPNDSLLTQDLTTQVERALAMLSPKEKEILRLRFGIGEEGEHTLEEVGKRFAVTRERIRQIEAKALRKLRHPLRGRNLRAFIEN